MIKITIENIDKLHLLSSELGVLTYLHNLVRYDIENDVICDSQVNQFRESSIIYLLDKQLETVIKIDGFKIKDDFVYLND